MLPTKFQFIWESGVRGEDFLEINQSKTGHKDGICGDDLSIVVQLVCDGKFSLPKKRSTDHKNSQQG